MTTPPAVVTPQVSAPRPLGGRAQPRRRPPAWLWIPAFAALIPAVVPFAFLAARVAGAGRRAIDIALSVETLRLVINTTALAVAVMTLAATIGVGAAWMTERTDLPLRRLFRVTVALPLVIPSYVLALTLLAATGPSGVLSEALGITIPTPRGFLGALLALTLSTYPFVYLTAAAALRRMDPAHEEAARGMGAGPGRVFRTIVLPQLRPSVAAGLLLVALYTLSDFGAVSLMRFDSFTRVIYAQYAGRLDRTPAAVLAVVLVLIALVVVWAERATRGRAAYHGRPVARPARASTISPARKAAGVGVLGLLGVVALGVPLASLLSWWGRPGRGAVGFPWDAVAGSITAATLAAVIAAALALPTAVLVTRHPSPASSWVERSSYAVFALPHITVGLGMVFFASRYLGSLYQSLTVLVLVYASIFFAQALGPTRAALLQVSPSIEEAARSLGSGPMRVMTRITGPLVRRGLLAGAVMVFLTTMKELPATLLLRPTGFSTLAVDIWSAADAVRYSRAAGPALLLIAVSAIPMYLLAVRRS